MKYLLLTLSLLLTSCDLFGGVPQPAPPRVSLNASGLEGTVPFTVSFTAEASPAVNHFSWAVGGELQPETSSLFTTTFEHSGLYLVSVSAGGASKSVTVKVNASGAVNPGPTIGKLKLTQTPGGPAPWAVRYTVKADVALDPSVPGLEARCGKNRVYRQLTSDFTCVHNTPETVTVRFVVLGKTTASAETVPKIIKNNGVAFAGRWRYRSRGVTETFSIVKGNETAGESADGRFKLFTVGQREGLVTEFTIDGRTVVLTPTPNDNGKQLYEGRVYGLLLEPFPETP